MVEACIACGGVLEFMLLTTGLGMLVKWLKARHEQRKAKCKCCKKKEHSNDTV